MGPEKPGMVDYIRFQSGGRGRQPGSLNPLNQELSCLGLKDARLSASQRHRNYGSVLYVLRMPYK